MNVPRLATLACFSLTGQRHRHGWGVVEGEVDVAFIDTLGLWPGVVGMALGLHRGAAVANISRSGAHGEMPRSFANSAVSKASIPVLE